MRIQNCVSVWQKNLKIYVLRPQSCEVSNCLKISDEKKFSVEKDVNLCCLKNN